MLRVGAVDRLGFVTGNCDGSEVENFGIGNVTGVVIDSLVGAEEDMLLEIVGVRVKGTDIGGRFGFTVDTLGDGVGGAELSVIGEVIGLIFGDEVCKFGGMVGGNVLSMVGNAAGFSIGCEIGENVANIVGTVIGNGFVVVGNFCGLSVGLVSGDTTGYDVGSKVKGMTGTGTGKRFGTKDGVNEAFMMGGLTWGPKGRFTGGIVGVSDPVVTGNGTFEGNAALVGDAVEVDGGWIGSVTGGLFGVKVGHNEFSVVGFFTGNGSGDIIG